MTHWLQSHQELLVAIGTLALALFGGLQIALDFGRRRSLRIAARAQLLGPAWLARRSLEAALTAAIGKHSAKDWSDSVGTGRHLDPLEAHLLAAIGFASGAPRKDAVAIARGFEEFLAFADNVNLIPTVVPALRDPAGHVSAYSPGQRAEINRAARKALTHLRAAIDHLAVVVPRRYSEPQLPHDDQLPLLEGSPDPNSMIPK
jgi:hypothetical protein